MRIQHNIMAMSAYRNYTNNVSAMKKNLEKLSSGYKINRAGDDAAGLAISEKMRAQITGLQTAQKNAKDGISLVQTAEGALTEVHDMLNRMVELATQSANGTYSNETDREQLQKEVEQLKSEINRIADSSNFNGLKLLDGTMAAAEIDNVAAKTGSIVDVTSNVTFSLGGTTAFDSASTADGKITDAANNNVTSVNVGNIALASAGGVLGTNTVAHKDGAGSQKTHFSLDLHDVKFDNVKGNKLVIQVGSAGANANGFKVELEGTGAGELKGSALVSAVANAIGTKVFIKGQQFNVATTAVAGGDNRISFEQNAAPTKDSEVVKADMSVTISGAVIPGAAYASGTPANATVKVTMPTLTGSEVDWANATKAIGSKGVAQMKDRVFSVKLGDRTISVTLGITADATHKADGYGTVQIASTDKMSNVASKITAALESIAKGLSTPTANSNASTFGPAYKDGDKIFVATQVKFKMNANGQLSIGTAATEVLKGKMWTVASTAGVLKVGASAAATAGNFGTVSYDYTDQTKLKVDGTFDWTGTNKADTGILKDKSVTVNIEGTDFTVKFVTASSATGAANEVLLDVGGEKPAGLINKIETNLNKQISAANAAKAAASPMADYVKISDISVSATAADKLKITAKTTQMTAPKGNNSVTKDHYNTQTTDTLTGDLNSASKKASTTFNATANMFVDGAKITFGGASYTFKLTGSGTGNVDLSDIAVDGKITTASKVQEAARRLADAASANTKWTVGASKGKLTFVEKGTQCKAMTTASKVAADFKLTLAEGSRVVGAAAATKVTYGNASGKSLTLQIGDTAEDFNQLKVDIRDCHANAMGMLTDKEITLDDGTKKTIKIVEKGNSINDVNISTQSGASKAVDIIKAAINYVSDVRGGLGATQNRLDHTINNLSVMTENIQDAESTIRDTDVADEMMAYTKNNILIQSAQAMLAQANQVPQGVLQLLQ